MYRENTKARDKETARDLHIKQLVKLRNLYNQLGEVPRRGGVADEKMVDDRPGITHSQVGAEIQRLETKVTFTKERRQTEKEIRNNYMKEILSKRRALIPVYERAGLTGFDMCNSAIVAKFMNPKILLEAESVYVPEPDMSSEHMKAAIEKFKDYGQETPPASVSYFTESSSWKFRMGVRVEGFYKGKWYTATLFDKNPDPQTGKPVEGVHPQYEIQLLWEDGKYSWVRTQNVRIVEKPMIGIHGFGGNHLPSGWSAQLAAFDPKRPVLTAAQTIYVNEKTDDITWEKPKFCDKCKKESANGKPAACQECKEALDNVWDKIRHEGLTSGSENNHGVKAREVYHAPNVGDHGRKKDALVQPIYYTVEDYGAASDGYVRFGISLLYDYSCSALAYYQYNMRSGSILLWMVKIESEKFAKLIRDKDWDYPGKDHPGADQVRVQAVRVFPAHKSKPR